MHIIELDFDHCSIDVDSAPVEINEKGILIGPIAKLCLPANHTNQSQTRYRFLEKISVCGKSADCVIEIGNGKEFSVTFSFDLIEFFESSILESKIIKAFEKYLDVKFTSNHLSIAFLDRCKCGTAIFYYDAKQGDLSLEIIFGSVSNENNSEQ